MSRRGVYGMAGTRHVRVNLDVSDRAVVVGGRVELPMERWPAAVRVFRDLG